MEAQGLVLQRLTDPVTLLGTRQSLLIDLAKSVRPSATPSVLAIFALGGYADYQQTFGTEATDSLVAHLASLFRETIGSAGIGYRPRQDEFVVLIDGEQDSAEAVLTEALSTLRRAGDEFLITPSYGAALLPDEADEAIAALTVADRRLEAISARGPRERRRSSRSQP
jgi:GGDEF domain-containing protein